MCLSSLTGMTPLVTGLGVTVWLADVLAVIQAWSSPWGFIMYSCLSRVTLGMCSSERAVAGPLRELWVPPCIPHPYVRLGYSRLPPPWGLRKELAFVLCLISQGLPSTPSEMSFTVQMALQLGDVWGRNSSDPTAGAGCWSTLRSPCAKAASFPLSPPWATSEGGV